MTSSRYTFAAIVVPFFHVLYILQIFAGSQSFQLLAASAASRPSIEAGGAGSNFCDGLFKFVIATKLSIL